MTKKDLQQLYWTKRNIQALENKLLELEAEATRVTTQLEEIKGLVQKEPESITEPETVSRGSMRAEPIIMRVTAYDLSYASCKKYPDHPEYGITASGVKVKEHHSIAAGPELPFGTKVFIPALNNGPNEGIYTVEDRGSAITENCIDIFLGESKYKECMEFGVQYLEAYILK